MKNIFLIIATFFLALTAHTQTPERNAYLEAIQQYSGGMLMTAADTAYQAKLPELQLPDNFSRTDLPYMVDNSTQPYFRPVFEQHGASCGQATAIGYNFTYEIDHARDLAADTSINQYPTHFTWNFMNGGDGWYGVSYFHSFEILRRCGNPNVYDYGDYWDDGKRWISGYDKYYNGMLNRINKVYSINTGSVDGIETLKNWIFDHIGSSDVGGVASFYANVPWNAQQLNDTTPEGGKYVISAWYPDATHAMTIVGYNDSIRWDYNEDGQYTNHLDINGDGILDPKDWEIGGVKVANSYGDDNLDSGFYYMMYKVLAEDFMNGGLWNRSVHVVEAKHSYSPELAMKISLKYNSRNKIKVVAGVSADTSAQCPQHIIDFPIFNYQGGHHYMQGHDTAVILKTIEFGLDVTPLLSYFEAGETAKFFFMIDENDPYNQGNGEVLGYSLMDYTGLNPEEIFCTDIPDDIVDNGRTQLSLVHDPAFQQVTIITEELPPFTGDTPFNVQMQASGGYPPYEWSILNSYSENTYTDEFPSGSGTLIMPVDYDSIKAVGLDFSFPFFGKLYDSLYIHKNAYLMFERLQMGWPYLEDETLVFRSTKMIAAYMNRTLDLIADDGDGVWFSGNANEARIKWKLSREGSVGDSDFNVILKLYPSGNIEIYYGEINSNIAFKWVSGISNGDKENYFESELSGKSDLLAGEVAEFIPCKYPAGLEISKDGSLNGSIDDEQQIYNINFNVCDYKFITDSKTLQLSSGLLITTEVDDGGNSIIEYGETIKLDLELKNISGDNISNINLSLYTNDPYVNIVDDECDNSLLLPGQSYIIEDAFVFEVSGNVPDQHGLFFDITAVSDQQTWYKDELLLAYAPVLQLDQVGIMDEDGILEPGETSDLKVVVKNNGHATASLVEGELISRDAMISINGNEVFDFGTLVPGLSSEGIYNLTADEDYPDGQVTTFDLLLEAESGISSQDTFDLKIGKVPVLVIDLNPNLTSGSSFMETLNEMEVLSEYDNAFKTDISPYKSIFICLGDQNANHSLSWHEGQMISDYLLDGGRVYMEGTETWRDDPETPAQPRFNILPEGAITFYDTIVGVNGSFTEGMKFENNASNIFNFYWIEPVEPAYKILTEDNADKACAIAYDQGTYKTIGATSLFGNLIDGSSPSTKYELLDEILEFFDILGGTVDIGEPEELSNNTMIVYPNPTNNFVNIDISAHYETSILSIYNSLGNLVYSNNISTSGGKIRIDISSWAGGIYIAELENGMEIISREKIIITK